MSSGPGDWYVRARGRTLGPFNQSQLISLRDRGRLSQDDEVSHDRRSWIKAAEVPGIYAKVADTRAQPSHSAATEWPVIALDEAPGPGQAWAAADVEPSWFVARGDSHHGPISHSDVQRLLHTGEIGPSSLVWKQGMPSWLPVSQVPELRMEASAVAANPYIYVPRTSGLAVASLVLGLLWLCGIGSVLAIVSGTVARSQIARSNGALTGSGLALLGLALGIAGLISSIAIAIIFVLLEIRT